MENMLYQKDFKQVLRAECFKISLDRVDDLTNLRKESLYAML